LHKNAVTQNCFKNAVGQSRSELFKKHSCLKNAVAQSCFKNTVAQTCSKSLKNAQSWLKTQLLKFAQSSLKNVVAQSCIKNAGAQSCLKKAVAQSRSKLLKKHSCSKLLRGETMMRGNLPNPFRSYYYEFE
jgi:hypothetical protein